MTTTILTRLFGFNDEGEPNAHLWHAAEGPRLWRHGRAHMNITGRGRRGYPNGTGRRQDIRANAEWRLFPRSGFGIGWQFKWGTNGSDTTPDVAFHLGRLGDLWLSVGGVIPYRWLERHRPDGKVDYDTRVFGVTVARDHFEWSCWAREGSWSRSDPWWMHQYHRWDLLILGRTATESVVVDSGTCSVPMPEQNYPAVFESTRHTNRHQRPLGRLRDRIVGPRTHTSVTVSVPGGVPIPGKGENSWDLGDDALMSVSGSTVDQAVGRYVQSVMRTRSQYGGEHMNAGAEEA